MRTETSISTGAVSVSAAAELALMKIPEPAEFAHARILVVGVGKMGTLGIKNLVAKGCRKITVANRNGNKAAAICEEQKGAEIIFKPFDHLLTCAAELDIIFTCTASETPLFLEQVGGFPRASHVVDGMRLHVDISLPHNVDPSVGDFEGAKVYNVDNLKEVVDANKEDRHCKAMESRAILADESQRIEEWRDSLETVPTIKKLRAYAERITLVELEKCLTKLGYNVPKKTKRAVDDLGRGIVSSLLHVDVRQQKLKDAERDPGKYACS